MSDPRTDSVLVFLEREFSATEEESAESSVPGEPSRPLSETEEGAMTKSANLLTPRSRLGPIFGVTQADINNAVSLLTGSGTFRLPVELLKRTFDVLISA